MDIKEEVKAAEAEIVSEVKKVEEVVVSEAEKIKTSVLAQKSNFLAQLDGVKKEMARLQQEFESKKTLGIRLEGALESLELLLKNLSPK
jgi:hypothetical protein